MFKIFPIALAFLFTACAPAPRTAARYDKPKLGPGEPTDSVTPSVFQPLPNSANSASATSGESSGEGSSASVVQIPVGTSAKSIDWPVVEGADEGEHSTLPVPVTSGPVLPGQGFPAPETNNDARLEVLIKEVLSFNTAIADRPSGWNGVNISTSFNSWKSTRADVDRQKACGFLIDFNMHVAKLIIENSLYERAKPLKDAYQKTISELLPLFCSAMYP